MLEKNNADNSGQHVKNSDAPDIDRLERKRRYPRDMALWNKRNRMHNRPADQVNQFTEKNNLLIVDDEQEVLNSLKISLRKTFKIFTADNVLKAQEILKNNEIHIAMCDERLPGESGSELLSRIKDEYPNIVRILTSGHADTTSIMAAINKANVFKFIVKPWDSKLMEILEEARHYYSSKTQNQYKDTLTKLKSSAAVYDFLHNEIKRSNRYKTNLSVVLLSIASPKKDSELHSFLIDRFLLQKIAEILLAELRDSDIAGRQKDNNFLILLTETDKKGADIFLGRFLKSVEKFDREINRGLLPFEVKPAQYTTSGENPMSEDDILSLLYSHFE